MLLNNYAVIDAWIGRVFEIICSQVSMQRLVLGLVEYLRLYAIE